MRTVKFLEELGRKPALTDVEYTTAINALGVDEAETESLLGRDASKLASLLGGRAQMWCAVMAPDDMPAEDRPSDEPMREEPETDQPDES